MLRLEETGFFFPVYRSEHDSDGKEILFPVLNAEYFAECLCPVGCPDHSPEPWPSFPSNAAIKRETEVRQLPPLDPVSCCVTICRRARNSHFLLSPPHTLTMWKKENIWSQNCFSDQAIFEPLLSIVVLNPSPVAVWNLLRGCEGCVPCPPNLSSRPPQPRAPKRFLGHKIQFISSVRAFPCSTPARCRTFPAAHRAHMATLFKGKRNKGLHVDAVFGDGAWREAAGVEFFPSALTLDEKLENSNLKTNSPER